jgi:hypothetical protein
MEKSPSKKSHKTRIISKVLKTAVKLWLKSQVSHVSQLEVEINASDRELLSGCIPWVCITAENAVYKGIHITQIKLVAETIQVNISGILKGQPVRLLEPLPVLGNLIVEEEDLNNSLASELLATGLNDVLLKFLPSPGLKSQIITWQNIILANDQILLKAIISSGNQPEPLQISLNLDLINGNELKLHNIQVIQNEVSLLEEEEIYHLNLGSDVNIQELTLISGQLVCQGKINVNP